MITPRYVGRRLGRVCAAAGMGARRVWFCVSAAIDHTQPTAKLKDLIELENIHEI